MVPNGSRSHSFLKKLNQEEGNMQFGAKSSINSNIKTLHLVILGVCEMFGLEEIMAL